jgi:ankyrin repeat protein
VDILQLLVEAECPISEVDRFGRTPLYEACINRHEPCVKLLRSANAKLMLPDPGGEMCRVAFAGDVVLMKIFILAGAKVRRLECFTHHSRQ